MPHTTPSGDSEISVEVKLGTIVDGELHRLLMSEGCFPESGTRQGHRRQIEPDWASLHRELKRKHATLSILWDEFGYRPKED